MRTVGAGGAGIETTEEASGKELASRWVIPARAVTVGPGTVIGLAAPASARDFGVCWTDRTGRWQICHQNLPEYPGWSRVWAWAPEGSSQRLDTRLYRGNGPWDERSASGYYDSGRMDDLARAGSWNSVAGKELVCAP